MGEIEDLKKGISSLISKFTKNPNPLMTSTYNFFRPSRELKEGLTPEGILQVVSDNAFRQEPSSFGVSDVHGKLMYNQMTGSEEQKRRFYFLVNQRLNFYKMKNYS